MKRGFILRNPHQKHRTPRNDSNPVRMMYCSTCQTTTPHDVRVGDFVDVGTCQYCKGETKESQS